MKTGFRIIVALFMACLLAASAISLSQSASVLYEQGLLKENADGDLVGAIAIFNRVVEDSAADTSIRAKAQLHIGMCFEKLGQREAQAAYQKVIDGYPLQHQEVALARERIAALVSGAGGEVRPVFHKLNIQTTIWYGGKLSPDGKRLVYNNPNDGTLWIMPLSSDAGPYVPGAPAIVNTGDVKVEAHGFAWSADGKWIAFNEKNNSREKRLPRRFRRPPKN